MACPSRSTRTRCPERGKTRRGRHGRPVRPRPGSRRYRAGKREVVDLMLLRGAVLKPTDILSPDYFHKVVDCQWACPAHTPVPEYIRMIAAGRYGDAYMVNWWENDFH